MKNFFKVILSRYGPSFFRKINSSKSRGMQGCPYYKRKDENEELLLIRTFAWLADVA